MTIHLLLFMIGKTEEDGWMRSINRESTGRLNLKKTHHGKCNPRNRLEAHEGSHRREQMLLVPWGYLGLHQVAHRLGSTV